MSLLDVVAAGVETAFAQASDFVSLGTYVQRTGAPVLDPVTDQMTVTTVTLTNVRMLRTSLQNEEREASAVAISDVKILIPGVDLAGLTPRETDTLTLNGVQYNVLVSKPVPGNLLWTIFAREK